MRPILALPLALLMACSVISRSGDEPFRCRVGADGLDPCDAFVRGARCSRTDGEVGTCVRLSDDPCDGVDNDGDGTIDEDGFGLAEVCNGFDEDCDGRVDEMAPPDEFRTELCNGADEDCDGTVDEGLGSEEVCNMTDDDCDGRVDEGVMDPEECNGLDDDCDGNVDEDVVSDATDLCNMRDDDCDGLIDEDARATAEVCNGIDDDCDETVDEDVPLLPEVCGNDADDDCDGSVDEGMPETCNNIDDDCDTQTDEMPGSLCTPPESCYFGVCEAPSCLNGGIVCDATQFCDPTDGLCKIRAGGECDPDTPCPDGQRCNLALGVCVTLTPYGDPCIVDSQCDVDVACVDLGALGAGGAERRCLSACCTQDDCPSGTVCRADPVRGSRLCLPSGLFDPGSRVADGGSCDNDAQCLSGVCQSNTCRATCTQDSHCTPDSCVALENESGTTSFACGRPNAGSGEGLSSCGFDTFLGWVPLNAECRRNRCEVVGGEGVCLDPCGGDEDCRTPSRPDWVCLATRFDDGSVGQTCVPPSGTPNGEACSSDSSCVSGYCFNSIDGADRCVASCCRTAQCGDGEVCKPIRRGEVFVSYCVPVN